MQIGPWRRLTSECRYENPWIQVFHEDVLTPASTPGIYGRVHFKGTAIGIVPIDDEGYTYLVGQYRYTLDEYSWEIPMGGCPAGEQPINAAKRELQEETGFTADHWQEIQTLHTSNSITDEKGLVFLAKGLTAGEMALEDSEDITVKRLPLKEAVLWVLDGKITDAISVAALLYLAVSENR
ncbi:MAG: NUDIX hydrolase [Pseudomonadales bacterium]|nr:NUDIX hydrolase [Pseudomonadales bacterium]